MVRPFTATLSGVVLRKRPPTIRSILEGGPVSLVPIRRKIGHTVASAHAASVQTVQVVAHDAARPTVRRLESVLVIPGAQKVVRPTRSQA